VSGERFATQLTSVLLNSVTFNQGKNPAFPAGFFINMSISDLEHLRRRIESVLVEIGIPDAFWSCVKATSFEYKSEEAHEGILVVWLTDRSVLEFHDNNGGLLKTVNLDQEDAGSKAA